MAVNTMTTVNLERKQRGFMDNLSSMAFEWLLMFLLFLDAALSYLLTKLARYCELQTPCLLCSRLDHVFGNEKPGFYRSLLCNNHRMEISSLVSCHIHGKLADARRMCEECLMSFSMRTKTTPESYRLLVGKLGVNLDYCGFQGSFPPKNITPGSSSSTWTCSCCSKTYRARTNTQRLLQLPVGFGTLKTWAKPPLPRLPPRGRLTRRDSFKKMRDKIPGSTLPRGLGNTGGNALSHVGYSELKINSDTESEYLFSDDDDRSSVIRENTSTTDSSGSLQKVHTGDFASVDQTHQGPDPGPSLLDQCTPLELNNPRDDVDCLGSDNCTEHGLGELNWEQANQKQYSPALPDFISLDDVSASCNVINGGGISEHKSDGPLPHNSVLSMLSELVVPNDIPPTSNVMTIPNGESPDFYAHENEDNGHKSVIKHGEVSAFASTMTAECVNNDHALDDNAPSMSSNLGPSEKCKSSDTGKGRDIYGMIAELYERSSSAESRDQILSLNEIGTSLDNASGRWKGHHDELQRPGVEGALVVQEIPLLGKIDSGYESFDGISVSEIEGESSFDRLKRQVEYDRSCLSSLYKELEEERNASEVAANQAMAMITRLQEEKASLHLEALQYLRMMEEQAEYDMEALEKANELLAEKEKEVQDLEAELEFFRANYLDETKGESLHFETRNVKLDKDKNIKSLLLDFEGEKLYISQCLKELERKLYPAKSLFSGAIQKEENGFLTPNDLSASRAPTSEGSDISIEENSDVIRENNHFDSNRSREVDLIAVENEISELDGRLQALEADRNLLEHALSSLRNGNDGLQFIKEIAHQLQELRKIWTEKRCPSVS